MYLAADLGSNLVIISSTLRPLVSGTFLTIITKAIATIAVKTKNVYDLSICCMYGKVRVSIKLAIQLVPIHTARAVLRASARKHSATYKNGIGPRPTAKQIINITMQTILI